ncbi:MAG: hypothetical protein ACO1Q7_18305 [Gemmatimonas sp.]
MRFEIVTPSAILRQDTSRAAVVDSTTAATTAATQPAAPEPQGEAFRTPQNAGFMYIAYTVAAVILGGYLIVIRRRWSALAKRAETLSAGRASR